MGTSDDLLSDDRERTIPWVTVGPGNWLHGRKVLLPPESFGESDHVGRDKPIGLDRKRIEESPAIESDLPVSRQAEADIYDFYGVTPSWKPVSGAAIAGVAGNMPLASFGMRASESAQAQQTRSADPAGAPFPDIGTHGQDDPHLRSAHDVIDYHIEARDGSIGHVEDIMIDSDGWTMRYLLKDTRNWWPGRKVLISSVWTRGASWSDRKVHVNMTRERVRTSPEYDPQKPTSRSVEERLCTSYGYELHWRS